MRVPTWLYFLVFTGLLIGNVKVYQTLFAKPVLTVSVLKVGKAESGNSATLVRTPSGKILLIDVGPDASIVRALGLALPPWQRRIDLVILTSTKSAFAGGLPALESRYHVSKRIDIGDSTAPYGSRLTPDSDIFINIIAPSTFTVSYGSTIFSISSSTSKGVYTSDGNAQSSEV